VTGNGLSSPDKTSEYNARAVRGRAAPVARCAATPLADCLAPGKATFALARNAVNPRNDKLTWSWTKGDAVAVTQLGDPTATTAYALCVYANGSLLLGGTAPPGPLWRVRGGTRRSGYMYSDRSGSNEGLTKVEATDGNATQTKALATGKGVNLPVVALPLTAAQLPVTVQLVTNDATPTCWSAEFTNPPRKNDGKRFEIRLP